MSLLPVLALLALATAWFLLPLVPALRELLRPTDIAPLKVVDRSSGYVAYFARNFRQYLEKQMAALPAEAQAGDFFGRFPDGTPFLRVHKRALGLEREAAEGQQDRLVVVDAPMALDGGETFLVELFARAPLTGGPRAVYRAIYAERELALGEGSTVLRWVHAGGRLTAGAGSVLRGRVSSDAEVLLGPEVTFERIGAPVIAVGEAGDLPPELPAALPLAPLPDGAWMVGDHLRIEGDFAIPEGTRVATSLVVAGALRIGVGAIVEGSAKAHGDLDLGAEAQVRGAAVTRTTLTLGPASWVAGPAIAEELVRMARGAVVGGPALPATVSAPVIEMARGATVFGQVSAMRGARTGLL